MATPALLRSRIRGLTALASNDLYALWRTVSSAAQARQALGDILPALIQTYGEAAAVVAAEWYDDARDKAGISGRFGGIPAVVRDPGVPGLIGWAQAEATSFETMLPLVIGGVQKRIANASRDTIAGSSLADPRSDGWQRVARPDGCWFCRAIAGRGAVFSEGTADFASHDSCNCVATPAWSGHPVPVKPFTPSDRNVPDADRARFKKWAADHGI